MKRLALLLAVLSFNSFAEDGLAFEQDFKAQSYAHNIGTFNQLKEVVEKSTTVCEYEIETIVCTDLTTLRLMYYSERGKFIQFGEEISYLDYDKEESVLLETEMLLYMQKVFEHKMDI